MNDTRLSNDLDVWTLDQSHHTTGLSRLLGRAIGHEDPVIKTRSYSENLQGKHACTT